MSARIPSARTSFARTSVARTSPARSTLFATLVLCGTAFAGQAFADEPSNGVYRIPYANGTDVYIGRDHVEHSASTTLAIDMNGRNGSEYTIVAAADGWIRYVEEDFSAQLNCTGLPLSEQKNNYVWIEHANGEWTKYSHMTKDSFTAAGRSLNEFVKAGTPLGKQGAVGCAGGPHLHFEVAVLRDSDPITTVGGFVKDNAGNQRNRIPRICGIPTRYFLDDTEYEARAVPGAVAPGHTEFSRRNIAAADYQCQVDQAVLAGYQLEFVDGFNSGSNTYFNAVFRPQGNAQWAAFHGLTKTAFADRRQEYIGKGFQIRNLESYHTASGVRYAVIFSKGLPSPVASYVDLGLQQHQDMFDFMTGEGYVPRNISVLSVGGELRYSAIYQKENASFDFGAWQSRSTMTSGEYQTVMEANKAAGRYPVYVNAYVHNGTPMFAAIWSSKALGLFKARHDQTSAQYHDEWQSAMDLDMTTRAVTGYVDDGLWRYAGIWRRDP